MYNKNISIQTEMATGVPNAHFTITLPGAAENPLTNAPLDFTKTHVWAIKRIANIQHMAPSLPLQCEIAVDF